MSNMDLKQKLVRFVREICAGRDESHGLDHMMKVTDNAVYIFEQEKEGYNKELWNDILTRIYIVAMLHDVADHKYDFDGTLKVQVREFVQLVHNDVEGLMRTIDLISYTTEQRGIVSGSPINYEVELSWVNMIVRHIVSDADKLEALGDIGVKRCWGYNKEFMLLKGVNASYDEIKENVLQHASDKLLRLKDNFIRTETGKKMAIPLHDELIIGLNNL